MNTTTVDHDAFSDEPEFAPWFAIFALSESLSRLIGEGGRSDLLAVAVAKHQQEFDARTLQDHVSPHTGAAISFTKTPSTIAPARFSVD